MISEALQIQRYHSLTTTCRWWYRQGGLIHHVTFRTTPRKQWYLSEELIPRRPTKILYPRRLPGVRHFTPPLAVKASSRPNGSILVCSSPMLISSTPCCYMRKRAFCPRFSPLQAHCGANEKQGPQECVLSPPREISIGISPGHCGVWCSMGPDVQISPSTASAAAAAAAAADAGPGALKNNYAAFLEILGPYACATCFRVEHPFNVVHFPQIAT